MNCKLRFTPSNGLKTQKVHFFSEQILIIPDWFSQTSGLVCLSPRKGAVYSWRLFIILRAIPFCVRNSSGRHKTGGLDPKPNWLMHCVVAPKIHLHTLCLSSSEQFQSQSTQSMADMKQYRKAFVQQQDQTFAQRIQITRRVILYVQVCSWMIKLDAETKVCLFSVRLPNVSLLVCEESLQNKKRMNLSRELRHETKHLTQPAWSSFCPNDRRGIFL